MKITSVKMPHFTLSFDSVKNVYNGLLGGACIGIGATAYCTVGGIVGACLFAIGLILVIICGADLFTGRTGFIELRSHIHTLPYILIYNIIGIATVALLTPNISLPIDIVNVRLGTPLPHVLTRSVLCGIIMTCVVKAARSGSWIPILIGVPAFIIGGLPHCVADVFYYTIYINNMGWEPGIVWVWLSSVAGNYIGCNIPTNFSPK